MLLEELQKPIGIKIPPPIDALDTSTTPTPAPETTLTAFIEELHDSDDFRKIPVSTFPKPISRSIRSKRRKTLLKRASALVITAAVATSATVWTIGLDRQQSPQVHAEITQVVPPPVIKAQPPAKIVKRKPKRQTLKPPVVKKAPPKAPAAQAPDVVRAAPQASSPAPAKTVAPEKPEPKIEEPPLYIDNCDPVNESC